MALKKKMGDFFLSSPNHEDGVDDPNLLLELVMLDLALIFLSSSFSFPSLPFSL
jgi:hypothetical protein